MKKIILLLGIVLLVSCKSKTGAVDRRIEAVKAEGVDVIKKDRAYELGKRVLEACNTSRFKPFSSNEATEKVRLNATREKISSTCQKINHRYGRFKDLNLIEITHNKETDEYVFRYSIDYEKKYFKKELKVTVNTENKVSGIATQEIPVKIM